MKDLLKFFTCGSVDDGKSTLIGRMLYDSKLIFADQEKALELESKVGSNNGEIDYSLLLDGLESEREQGITIDVAYRYFTTDNRSFIVADTPGHEQYTRNMAVGASFAELAIILVDATKGILTQTKRHMRICHLMGVKHIVVAVNKMDLIDFDEATFSKISNDFKEYVSDLDLATVELVPVSATQGDNITEKSKNTKWYQGKSLLNYLETIDVDSNEKTETFTLPVQRVSRPDRTFRGFQGQIASGSVKVGDLITVFPSKEQAHVKEIFNTDKNVEQAIKGQAVTITLDKEIDVSRGCVIVNDTDIKLTNMFTAKLLWMDDNKLVPGRGYLLKCGTMTVNAKVLNIKYKVDVNEGERLSAEVLQKNEIAEVDISLGTDIVFEAFNKNKALGSFILIDRITSMTSGCGTIDHSLRRSENVIWQDTEINKYMRANQKDQKPLTLWFTGLSGSGKSTLANEVEKRLFSLGKHTMLLDGDNVRHGLNVDLGFKEQDRVENIRRISEVAKLMNEAGLITLTSFISPFSKDRENARRIIGDKFIEIHVATPLEECERRDVKGLYKKARTGEIPNFTGIGSPYEAPTNPEISIDTTGKTIEEATNIVMQKLEQYLR